MARPLLALLTTWALLGGARASAQLVDITAASGLEAPHHLYSTEEPCPEPFGARCWSTRFAGGLAVDDIDADGDLDILMTRMGLPLALFRNEGPLAEPHFVEVAADLGLALVLDANGALFVDVDRDGDLDLLLSFVGNGGHRLYRNTGTASAPAYALDGDSGLLATGVGDSGFSIATGDVDRDGYPDLMFSEWRIDARATCSESGSRLYRNLGASGPGRFEDITRRAGVQLGTPSFAGPLAFAPALEDIDGDGWVDLAVTSDFGTSRLFWGGRDGGFTDDTRPAGVGLDQTGMGSTLGDVDADGDLDWFVSAVYSPPYLDGNRLYLQGEGDRARRFEDATERYGVADAGWGWGSAFVDLDHDGDLDLVVANGASRGPEDVFRTDALRIYLQEDHTFVDGSAALGVEDTLSGRGLVVADMDGDGDRDLIIANNGTGLRLYRNDHAAGSWLAVRARATASAPLGRGARVYVSAAGLSRRVGLIGTAGYFLGNGPAEAHFGLGTLTGGVNVEVHFPSGQVVLRSGVAVDQVLVVDEPAGVASPAPPLPAEPDCDGDGQPDVCAPDCDANGSPDACDLAAGALDCNRNSALDACERAAGFEVVCVASPEPPPQGVDAGPSRPLGGAAGCRAGALSGTRASASVLTWLSLLTLLVAARRSRASLQHDQPSHHRHP
jgi:hypothetical protein